MYTFLLLISEGVKLLSSRFPFNMYNKQEIRNMKTKLWTEIQQNK